MPTGSSTKARRVLAAILRVGWEEVRRKGSHRTLKREGWGAAVFAFHDADEIGPVMLAKLAAQFGFTDDDL